MDSMLPGSAALTDLVEKPLMVVLRDGRHLKGTLATVIILETDNSMINLLILSCSMQRNIFTI